MFSLRPVARFLALVVLISSAFVFSARAETSAGIRGGLSSNPDQFLFGGQLNLDAISEHVYIVPSGEAGFGDDAFTLSFNGDVQYRFDVEGKVRPYAGGGLTVYYFNLDNGGGSDTNLGVTVLGGIFFGQSHGHPMFVEAKAGLTDEVPDWKFIFGINF